MSDKPKISVVLCTVRPDQAYVDYPDWHCLGTLIQDLEKQTFKDFEFIIVDGLFGLRNFVLPQTFYPVRWLPPKRNIWTEGKRFAVCSYRNTALRYAQGELVVNLDDACRLPPEFLEYYWTAYSQKKHCMVLRWPEHGDHRLQDCVIRGVPGRSATSNQVEFYPDPPIYGFGSYPLEVALKLNGYDEAYDGGQGLEDCDWGVRLLNVGVKFILMQVPGFQLLTQSRHDPRVIDLEMPVAKCCNRVWRLQRIERHMHVANTQATWTRGALQDLVSAPCQLLNADGSCSYHAAFTKCDYFKVFARNGHPAAFALLENYQQFIFDLRQERQAIHG